MTYQYQSCAVPLIVGSARGSYGSKNGPDWDLTASKLCDSSVAAAILRKIKCSILIFLKRKLVCGWSRNELIDSYIYIFSCLSLR